MCAEYVFDDLLMLMQLWRVDTGPDGKAVVEFLSNLARHTKAVNVVRFSPNGELLASGGDGMSHTIDIWRIKKKKWALWSILSSTPADYRRGLRPIIGGGWKQLKCQGKEEMLRIMLKHNSIRCTGYLSSTPSGSYNLTNCFMSFDASYPLWIPHRCNHWYPSFCPFSVISACMNAAVPLNRFCSWHNGFRVIILITTLSIWAKRGRMSCYKSWL